MLFYKEYKPTRKLDKFIECYWVLKGTIPYHQIWKECLVPGGRAEIIFTDSEFFWYGKDKLGKPVKYSDSFLLGQRTSVNYIGLTGNYHLTGVRFKHGCQSLFRICPANKYTNKLTQLNELYGESGKILKKTILQCKNRDSKIRHIEKWLVSNLHSAPDDWRQIQDYITKINSENTERISIKQLSERYGWQYKKTERVFLKYTGYTPKTFIKLIRFKRVLEANVVERESLTQKAYTFGFYDQSHFIREFYNYTGDKPSSFYKKPSLLANLLYKKSNNYPSLAMSNLYNSNK